MIALITPREHQVLEQISFGYTTKEIASSLYVSQHTIESHRKNLLLKMEARNTAALVRVAFEHELLKRKSLLKAI